MNAVAVILTILTYFSIPILTSVFGDGAVELEDFAQQLEYFEMETLPSIAEKDSPQKAEVVNLFCFERS